jgi:FkbM family methyltransferase
MKAMDEDDIVTVDAGSFPGNEQRMATLFGLQPQNNSMKYDPKLIYDVGMNNGDDTAYYMWRGFRVLAIEANPELVQNALTRFAREIRTGRLMILNVGIAEEQGRVLPFWICDADSRLSSFDRGLASLNGSCPHHEIRVPCRGFRSILEEFGVPFYMKVDIQGYDYLCVKDLDSQQLPKFISVSDINLLGSLYKLGFNYFKCITQRYYLPLQLPLTVEASRLQRAEWLQQNRNPLIRAFRKLGGRHWIERQFNRIRTRDGWLFPDGSSGPFGDDLPGRWLSYNELSDTYSRFLRLRWQSPRSLLWAPGGILSNPFNIDLHACRA